MVIRAVILAAGQGKRMHSHLPKVLHRLADKPLLEHVVNKALTLSSLPPVVIYGHQGEQVKQALPAYSIDWVEQKEQLGTGHAVLQALPFIQENESVLVLYGDVPLISLETLERLFKATPKDSIGFITTHLDHPTGYGRVKRNAKHEVCGIVEEKDASAEELLIKEVNTGIYLIPAPYLKKWLPQLKNNNAQREYYLPDVIGFAVAEHIPIHTIQPTNKEEILGVNDRGQLAHLERFYQRQQAKKLMQAGVTIADPERIDIRGDVQIGRDVFIDINVILEGKITIGDGCVIGPFTVLRNAEIGARVEIKSHSVIEGATVSSDCIVGPFARLRPGALLATRSHVGNFVEIKNSVVGEGSKINHLSYVGDSLIGKRVNVGAGTITCNYDGVNKNKTIIGDDAFIGSCSQLVAPVTIGEGATIGAGSTITEDAPANKLTLARARQQSIEGWQRPQKQKQES